MAEDKFERLGPMFSAIGEEAAAIVGGDPDGVYIYVEVGDRWIGPSLFKDEGDVIRYYDPTSDLSDLIMEAWEAEDPDKRWSVMEYEIRGTTFDVQFRFPDEVDVESFEVDRREETLKRRYGERPVVYPPVPERFMELK